jgi:hypothetical protein
MIEVLGSFGDTRFSLYGFFQGSNGGIGRDFEGEEVGIIMGVGGDGQGDAPLKCQQTTRLVVNEEGTTNIVKMGKGGIELGDFKWEVGAWKSRKDHAEIERVYHFRRRKSLFV